VYASRTSRQCMSVSSLEGSNWWKESPQATHGMAQFSLTWKLGGSWLSLKLTCKSVAEKYTVGTCKLELCEGLHSSDMVMWILVARDFLYVKPVHNEMFIKMTSTRPCALCNLIYRLQILTWKRYFLMSLKSFIFPLLIGFTNKPGEIHRRSVIFLLDAL